MAKFKLELDRRVQLNDGKYNLSVRMCNGNDVMFLKIISMTPEQYERVFVKKSDVKKDVKFRSECNEFLSKCEDIFADMNPFDKKRYRDLVYGRVEPVTEPQLSLKLVDLIDRYLESRTTIKLHTKDMYKTAINKFNAIKPGITVRDITPSLLMEFEKDMLEADNSPFTVSSYMVHLRSLINHFMKVDKIVPQEFKYPFGKYGGYIIRKGINRKLVMSKEEIKKVVEFNDFQTTEQKYARDLWVLSYWCNGMNYADLFRMKWTNIHDDLIIFNRMKTENTMRNHSREIVVPVLPKLRELIEKVGVKNSLYILGHLDNGYNEKTFQFRKDWQLAKIRVGLTYIEEKLKLKIPLRMKTARDCYSETLRRAGYDADIRDEMMGHAPVYLMAAHYNGVIDKERLIEINSCLVGITC
jgi:integrase